MLNSLSPMPKLEYFVVAEPATVDQFTNRVSIFNVYDHVVVSKFPKTISHVVCVCSWNAKEEDKDQDYQVAVTIRGPDGEHGPFTSNFTVKGRRHRTILSFEAIQVSKPGPLVFEITLNGEHKASHVIDIDPAEFDK